MKTYLSFLFALTLAFGTLAWSKSDLQDDLSPREKVKILFKESTVPASFNDFDYLVPGKQRCIVFPPDTTAFASIPVWFRKWDIKIAPDSPLFPGGEKRTVLFSSFKERMFSINERLDEHFLETNSPNFRVKYWGDIGVGSEGEVWDWMTYTFRKSGDLVLFSLNIGDGFKDEQTGYGYCWQVNP